MPKEKNTGGRVIHTMGWPTRNEELGGGFIYNMADGHVSIGFVVGLDYLDPRLDPVSDFNNSKRIPISRASWTGASSTPTAQERYRRRLLGAASVLP